MSAEPTPFYTYSSMPTPMKTEPHDDCCVDSSAPQGPARLYAGRVMGVKVKDEPEFSDEDPVHVKEEDTAECGVSEAAKLAGLYTDHRVQGELVLGPQRLQACVSVFALHAAAVKHERPELQECSMRLERLLDDRSHGTAERDASLDSISVAPVLETETIHIEDKSENKITLVRDCWVRLERCDILCAATTHTDPEVTSAQSMSEQKTVPLQKQKQHNLKNATTTNKYVCDTCGNTYKEKKWLIRHLHPRKPKKHTCQICNKFMLTYHELTHTGARPKSFRKLQHVSIHKRTHTGEKPYSCQKCNKKFVDLGSLNAHMKVHKGVKPYSCETCHKRFIDASRLKKHQRIHGIKPYSCNTCNKKFAYLHVLKGHLRTHTKEKPYSCEICKKQFSCSQTVRSHKRVHSGEKPYSCEICKKQFSHSQSLRTHKRVHSAENFIPFSCKTCDKKFKQLVQLKTHALIHLDKMLWECVICGKKFRQLVDLKQHKLIHTGLLDILYRR